MTQVEDNGQPDEVRVTASQQPVDQLPPEVLPYLLSSRYCEVDKLSDAAWALFGQTPLGWGAGPGRLRLGTPERPVRLPVRQPLPERLRRLPAADRRLP